MRILGQINGLSFKGLRPKARPAGSPSAKSEGNASRIFITMIAFMAVYALIAGRLVLLGMADASEKSAFLDSSEAIKASRPDILDRNGEILATDIKTASLFAEPRRIEDVDETVEKLGTVLPELRTAGVRRRLESDAGFIWLKREITPPEQKAIHQLGLPGIGFLNESRRFYPGGNLAGHIVGHVNVDNQGIAGLEKYFDSQGLADLQALGFATDRPLEPVTLSVDLRAQHAVRDELSKAMARYQSIAAIGIVLDVETGEVVAMSSLPDYNPNNPKEALEQKRMNRATSGVFEMGSVFKTFTTAMALDSGKVSISDHFDATKPIRIARHTIRDFHAKNKVLSVPEVFIYSSNIGTAKMALAAGIDQQQDFLKRLGMMSRIETELPETAKPILPARWTDLSAMTISFGHGLSVSPMHTAVAAATLMNGGNYLPPTFLPRSKSDADQLAVRIVDEETSAAMRYLFRMNVEKGSGRRAEVPGYMVGGKTGTAEKVENGRYVSSKRFNSFLAAFPIDKPRYVVLVTLDEPQPEEGMRSATAGLNTAPTVAAIIRRIAPMMGVMPRFGDTSDMIAVSY